MRRVAFVAFAVLAPLLAAADGAQGVDDFIEQLRSKYLREREAAVDSLVQCGPTVTPRVTELLRDADARVQRAAVEVLCRLGTAESIAPLLPLLSHADPTIRDQVRSAFQHAGRTLWPALEAARDADPKIAPDIQELLEGMTQDDIEEAFASQVMEDGTTGFYAGQFAKLKELGPDVGPMLTKMAGNSFEFNQDRTSTGRFRVMAIDALADIGCSEAIPDLMRVVETGGDLGRAAAGALWRLGQKEPAQKIEADLKESMGNGAFQMQAQVQMYLAEIYSRTDQHGKAVEMYQGMIGAGQGNYTTYYNMACAYSRMGQKKEALSALRKAATGNFRNVNWMKMDGDLEAIRGEPEYKAIIEELGGGTAEEPSTPSGGSDGGTE